MTYRRAMATRRPKAGERVVLDIAGTQVQGLVIEDRGPVGAGGRRLLRVRAEVAGAEPLEFEIPEDEVTVVHHASA